MEYDEIVGLVRDGYEVCSPAYKETKDDAVLENALFVRWQSELVRGVSHVGVCSRRHDKEAAKEEYF